MRPAYLAILAPVVLVSGCSVFAAEDDSEDEPVDTATGSVISNVDCRTTRQAAYDHGRKTTIDVIEIGGKPTSKATGHAFLKMQKAAHAAGVRLVINSGFRTMSEQQYLYNCYRTGRCNNGNLAARPGYSNHQNGRALDLTTSSWLANNASRFGFRRTVPSEAWHYEYSGADPGGPCSGSGSAPPPPDDDADPPTGAPEDDDDVTGAACSNDGQCNPGSDGAGKICKSGHCVDGCRTSAQCPGSTSCRSGQCR